MLGKSPNQKQKNLFAVSLKELVDPRHELIILSERIDWKAMEEKFADKYSHTGQPSKPVRLMAGVLILKQLYNYRDETIEEAWVQNPYYQYFCGEDVLNGISHLIRLTWCTSEKGSAKRVFDIFLKQVLSCTKIKLKKHRD